MSSTYVRQSLEQGTERRHVSIGANGRVFFLFSLGKYRRVQRYKLLHLDASFGDKMSGWYVLWTRKRDGTKFQIRPPSESNLRHCDTNVAGQPLCGLEYLSCRMGQANLQCASLQAGAAQGLVDIARREGLLLVVLVVQTQWLSTGRDNGSGRGSASSPFPHPSSTSGGLNTALIERGEGTVLGTREQCAHHWASALAH